MTMVSHDIGYSATTLGKKNLSSPRDPPRCWRRLADSSFGHASHHYAGRIRNAPGCVRSGGCPAASEDGQPALSMPPVTAVGGAGCLLLRAELAQSGSSVATTRKGNPPSGLAGSRVIGFQTNQTSACHSNRFCPE